ncbi:hypothetical protein AAMO2058_001382300 [Amorphochlora amoebiformis]
MAYYTCKATCTSPPRRCSRQGGTMARVYSHYLKFSEKIQVLVRRARLRLDVSMEIDRSSGSGVHETNQSGVCSPCLFEGRV